MATWQVSEAKRRFGELIDRVQAEGPQIITRHGREKAVIMSLDTYHKMRSAKDFKTHLLSGPKVDDFEIERLSDLPRDIEF